MSISAYTFPQLEPVPASTEAADLLSAAWAEAEQVREQARQEGLALGRSEGLEQARAEAAGAIRALQVAALEVGGVRDELRTILERQAAELALAISEQVLAGSLKVRPDLVLDVTRTALRRLSDRHRVTVLVNPADLDLLTEASASLTAELGGIDSFEVQADRRTARGGVVVRTDYGEIDATLSTQLERARELIESALATGDGDDGEADDPRAAAAGSAQDA